MRRGLLALLAIAAVGCVVPLVNEGQNPIHGCTFDKDCPSGSTCNDGGCIFTPRLCMNDGQCDPGQRCLTQGYCAAANFGYCEACLSNPDCDSGICAVIGDGGPICGATCDSCPSTASCQELFDGSGNDAGLACLPSSGSCG
jgi:hypothetical protein